MPFSGLYLWDVKGWWALRVFWGLEGNGWIKAFCEYTLTSTHFCISGY